MSNGQKQRNHTLQPTGDVLYLVGDINNPLKLAKQVNRSAILMHTMICRDIVLMSLIKKYVVMVIRVPRVESKDADISKMVFVVLFAVSVKISVVLWLMGISISFSFLVFFLLFFTEENEKRN